MTLRQPANVPMGCPSGRILTEACPYVFLTVGYIKSYSLCKDK